jgi:hypothetical protein
MPSNSTGARPSRAENQQEGTAHNKYDLLVVNTEIGITGTVSITAFNEDEAVRFYERDNPACAVISILRAVN